MFRSNPRIVLRSSPHGFQWGTAKSQRKDMGDTATAGQDSGANNAFNRRNFCKLSRICSVYRTKLQTGVLCTGTTSGTRGRSDGNKTITKMLR